MNEPSQMRISDGDRHQVAEVLQRAAGEGRLDLDELGERLEATYAAKVYADLVPIVADLPENGATPLPVIPPQAQPASTDRFRPPTHAAPAGSRHDTSIAIMSGQDRKGIWEIGPTHNAFTLMGGILIDLREAVFTSREVVINANAIMGGIDIYVNAGTRVSVEGVGIMGGFDEGSAKVPAEIGPDSPLVRVKGIALMAGVTVTRKQMPGEKRRFLRRG